MATVDGIRDQVASSTLASLVRLAGGGYATTNHYHHHSFTATAHSSITAIRHDCTSSSDASLCCWVEELRRIAYSSASFPNGVNSNSNALGANGKPHDVEVRAALMLYHRIMPRGKTHGGKGGGKGKAKRRRKQSGNVQCSNSTNNTTQKDDDVLCNNNELENGGDITVEIISDYGTRREIDSIRTLANLLSVELERELSPDHIRQSDADDDGQSEDKILGNEAREINSQPNTVSFTDIRADNSGIICLISKNRSKQLHSAGRVPCPHCTKWFKGAKGLWWHQLSSHGMDYSIATESAAGIVNALAIVPYREQQQSLSIAVPIDVELEEEVRGQDEDINIAPERNAFDMVKMGNYDEFVSLVEEGTFHPKSHLDRNGATALHWAAGCGRLESVAYLIEKCGCCPNEAQQGKRSFLGRTPLHWAARNGHLNVVEYLVASCRVDIDAKTSDGTTAFCWASWQGHLDIMKFLHESGCDIHTTNSFGCNAVLWNAQGDGTSETMAWLLDVGSDFGLVNSNGHTALHKAAQRGCSGTIRWLVDNFLVSDGDIDGSLFIGPDLEGNCPSYLCGMECLNESMARWLSKQECEFIVRSISLTSESEDYLSENHSCVPFWLRKELQEAKAANNCRTSLVCDVSSQWGAGFGVRRMALALLARSNENEDTFDSAKDSINNLDDID